MFLELDGVVLACEGSDLDAPAAAGSDGVRRLVDVNADTGGSGTPDAGLLGGSDREVDNAVGHEGSPVGDAHDGGLSGLKIGDLDERAHGQRAVGSGDAV